MSVEVIGVDHIFVSVGDLGRSEEFYDPVMTILGFRKGEGTIGGDPHLFYYNRQLVYSLRPASEGAPTAHDPYAPGCTASACGWWTRPALSARRASCGRAWPPRAQLDEATWTTAWSEGRAMTTDEAIACALNNATAP